MNNVTSLAEARRLRRTSIVNLTLTDLLMMVLFVLLLFTFRATEEGREEITGLEAELQRVLSERNRIQEELTLIRKDLVDAKERIRRLEEENNRLRAAAKDTLPTGPSVVDVEKLREENRLLRDENRILREENRLLKARLEAAERRLQQPERETAGRNPGPGKHGKGTGFPRCPVTDGFLLNVTLARSGNLTVKPAWDAGAEVAALGVPGVRDLIESSELSQDTFRQHAERIVAWSDKQDIPCRFHVRANIGDPPPSLEIYRRQLNLIERHFYALKP